MFILNRAGENMNFIVKTHCKICRACRDFVNRIRFGKRNCTIISSNCVGGFISHWLRMRFNSPTINLFILPSDFNIMLRDFDFYFSSEAQISKCTNTDKPYPVGEFETGVRLYFMHYQDFDDAVSKWRERCARIDKSKLYIMMVERDGCVFDDLVAFEELPFENKVVFTHKDYNGIKSSYKIDGFENDECVGQLHYVKSNLTGKRYIDQFDYVSFLKK